MSRNQKIREIKDALLNTKYEVIEGGGVAYTYDPPLKPDQTVAKLKNLKTSFFPPPGLTSSETPERYSFFDGKDFPDNFLNCSLEFNINGIRYKEFAGCMINYDLKTLTIIDIPGISLNLTNLTVVLGKIINQKINNLYYNSYATIKPEGPCSGGGEGGAAEGGCNLPSSSIFMTTRKLKRV